MADDERLHSTTQCSEAQEYARQLRQILPIPGWSLEEDVRLHAHAIPEALVHAPAHAPPHVLVGVVVPSFVSP